MQRIILMHFMLHCVKSVQIRSFFCSLFSHIQTECGKIRTSKNSVFGHFTHYINKKQFVKKVHATAIILRNIRFWQMTGQFLSYLLNEAFPNRFCPKQPFWSVIINADTTKRMFKITFWKRCLINQVTGRFQVFLDVFLVRKPSFKIF